MIQLGYFPRALVVFLLTVISFHSEAQVSLSAVVYDSRTGVPIPFATVKFAETGSGTLTDLDGRFRAQESEIKGAKWIEVSCLGYRAQRINLPFNGDKIPLVREASTLKELIVRPQKDKMRRILEQAIAHKNQNNPEKYDWYRCNMYYKMVVDFDFPDTLIKDTTEAREIKDFNDHQHLLMAETYSIRRWQRPANLQENVLGSRISGFKKSMFTGLVTDVLPFHSYNNYLTLNGKDYHNPVSKGYEQYYKFSLADQLVQGDDTVWILSFKPRGKNANELSGKVYINSNGFAISSLIATTIDTVLKQHVKIEQQYSYVTKDGIAHWFPSKLNYQLDWEIKSKKSAIEYHLKGTSLVDSVGWTPEPEFKFDKAHTIKLTEHADELRDSSWAALRPIALEMKEQRTYKVIDSIGEVLHFDNLMSYFSKLPDGRVPVGPFDIDLKRIYSTNYFETNRFGLGLQTNEKVNKYVSVGGWAGYGVSDAHWKYGGLLEIYPEHNKEFVIHGDYSHDLLDPGRVNINADLNKSYLNSFLLSRVDAVTSYNFSVKKKFGYFTFDIAGSDQKIIPQYHYSLLHDGVGYNNFSTRELSLGVRYAFGERTAPVFGFYAPVSTKYPIFYAKTVYGQMTSGSLNVAYSQGLAAMAWSRHINRVGNERMLITCGKSFSDAALPLSKLFAGTGYRYDLKSGNEPIYTFGGLITAYPYQFYSDEYVDLCLRHRFDWKFWVYNLPHTNFSSAPSLSFQYNFLTGSLSNRQAQQSVAFSVPSAYHEFGALVNDITRLKYLDLCYLTVSVGYFYHLQPGFADLGKGRVVIGGDIVF